MQAQTASGVKGSLQVKNNIYYAVLNLKDASGKRKLKWISTGLAVRNNKRRAEEVLEQLKKEYNANGPVLDSQQISFLGYLETWLQIRKGDLQETTWSSYQYMVQGNISRYFKPLALSIQDVQTPHIEMFLQHLYSNGLSSNTAVHYYAVLMTFFKYARKKKVISENPMEEVDKPAIVEYRASFYSAQEVLDMLEAVRDDVLFTTIVLTAYYGLRRSEVIGLRWGAIDFEHKKLTINHKVVQTHSGGVSMITCSNRMKTRASLRTYPFLPMVETALLAEKKRQEEYRLAFKGSYSKKHQDYVCLHPDGSLIAPDYVSSHFAYLLKKHNLRTIRFHDLRHTCASLLVALGIPMKMIQEWLGHSAFQTTANIYSHLATDTKDIIAESLAGKLSVSTEDFQ
jgi:integrase